MKPENNNGQRPEEQKKLKPSRIGFLEKVAKGLGEKPAYLLYFVVCFLVLTGGTSLGVYGVARPNTVAIVCGAIVAGLAIVGCLVVVHLGEKKATGSLGLDTVANVEFVPIFHAIQRNLNSCFRYGHSVFQEMVRKECEEFQAATSHWAEGKLVVSERPYNKLLVRVYESADKNVFATSTLSYFDVWRDYLGSEILKAHARSKVDQATRVFVFESLAEVTEEHLKEMARQQESGKVNVRLWGNVEDVTFNLPKNVNANFAFIDDGDVIASSAQTETGKREGTFYFKDEDKRQNYRAIIENLNKGSMTLDEFMKWKTNQPDNTKELAK